MMKPYSRHAYWILKEMVNMCVMCDKPLFLRACEYIIEWKSLIKLNMLESKRIWQKTNFGGGGGVSGFINLTYMHNTLKLFKLGNNLKGRRNQNFLNFLGIFSLY